MNFVLQTYDLTGIGEGEAILLVGVFALLLTAAVAFRNPAAVVAWGFSVLMFVMSGLYDIGFEFVWISIFGTVVLVTVGAIVRWSL